MPTIKEVLLKNGIGPKLVPFFKTTAIYFVMFIPVSEPSLGAALLKCLPILSLVVFVLLHGMSRGDEYSYSRRILFGLVFSAVADALLVWDEYFFHGLCVFLCSQVFYISAFGFRPLKLHIAAIIYPILFAGLCLVVPHVEGAMRIGVIVYGVMLSTMVWRAVARVELWSDLSTWTKLCSCVGGIVFAISDTYLGLNAFYTPLPYSQMIIMSTYYAAQLGISLSVVDCKASYLDSLKRSGEQADETESTSQKSQDENVRKRNPIAT